MPVNSKHPDYLKFADKWEIVRKIVDNNAKELIPDVDPEDKERNEKYRDSAILTNFTALTKQGLLGCVFRKPPVLEVPPELEYTLEDVTGGKVSVLQFAQDLMGDVLEIGRDAILVDYPQAEEGLSAAQVQALDLKARLQSYDTETIINWQEEYISGKWQLSLVVLEELTRVLGEDGFAWVEEKQYRVLRLIDGDYTVSLYDKHLNLKEEFQPRGQQGQLLDFIPLYFIGAQDNNGSPDKPPLYDLASINLGHYKNSADYEENTHMHGQSTLFVTSSMSVDDWNRLHPDGVRVGARTGHFLGESGQASMVQAGANGSVVEAMQQKENQAVMLGARLITPNAANETVEAARMRHSGETSALQVIVNNVESALTRALKAMTVFMGGNEESIELELNRDFYDRSMTPQEVVAAIQLKQEGIIAESDVRAQLRATGQLAEDRTDEDIDEEVEGEDVLE